MNRIIGLMLLKKIDELSRIDTQELKKNYSLS